MSNTISEVTSSYLPGFKFHPSDEELLLHYLKPRILKQPDQEHYTIIPDIKLADLEPSKLAIQYNRMFSDNELFCFCELEAKYLNSERVKRTTGAGKWKQSGSKCSIMENTGKQIGIKKTLVFYEVGQKTDWVMNEYHLSPKYLSDDRDENEKLSVVACRIKKGKGNELMTNPAPTPANREGDHNNPNNEAADNHNAVDAQSEQSVLEFMEGLPDIISPNTTPAYQPQAGPEEGSSSFFDLSYDQDGNRLDHGYVPSRYSNPADYSGFDCGNF